MPSHDQAKKAYIGTYTGKQFFLLEPRLEDIDIVDIAHSLSQQCRWTGHTKFPYSVAQHSYYCSFIGPENEAFDRLCHDMAEAYLSDMSRPLKHFTESGDHYRKLEKIVQGMIATRFGFSPIEPPSVKLADNFMLYAERQQLMDLKFKEAEEWPSYMNSEDEVIIEEWTARYAEFMFLERFNQLYNRRIN